jgi:hypothetical protein
MGGRSEDGVRRVFLCAALGEKLKSEGIAPGGAGIRAPGGVVDMGGQAVGGIRRRLHGTERDPNTPPCAKTQRMGHTSRCSPIKGDSRGRLSSTKARGERGTVPRRSAEGAQNRRVRRPACAGQGSSLPDGRGSERPKGARRGAAPARAGLWGDRSYRIGVAGVPEWAARTEAAAGQDQETCPFSTGGAPPGWRRAALHP